MSQGPSRSEEDDIPEMELRGGVRGKYYERYTGSLQRTKGVPPGWGDDALSAFLQTAHENSFFVFAHHRNVYDLLNFVNDTFDRVLGVVSHTNHPWPAFFVARSHSAYLAATRLAVSGEVTESFASLRLAIEHAWYALHISCDVEQTKRFEIWLNRDDSDQSKWDAIKIFKSGDLKDTHRRKDPETARILELLYERAISFGAHPNPNGMLTSMTRNEDERTLTHSILYLNAQILPLMFALKSNVEVAVSILRVFGLIFTKQYVAAGLLPRLEQIVENLNDAFKPYLPV